MKLTITATKKWGYTLFAGVFILLSALLVYAFQSGQQPSVFGHSSNEISFNFTNINPTTACAMSSYSTIPNSNGSTFCGFSVWDDDSTVTPSGLECDIRRRSDGLWEFKFDVGCAQTNCFVQCFKINGGE